MTAARLSPFYLAAALGAAVALAGPAAASEGTVTSAAATAATQNGAAPAPVRATRARSASQATSQATSHVAARGIAAPVLTPVRYAGAPSAVCSGSWCGRLVMLMHGIGF